MMNKKTKKIWIDALRSGNYKKTCGTLKEYAYPFAIKSDKKNIINHCAIGVLIQETIPEILDVVRPELLTEPKFYYKDEEVCTTKLTPKLLKKFGLTINQLRDIADLNDDEHNEKKISFNDIADYIEKFL
jgi:hypothetical protein